jgi:hypothetical protein
MSTCHRNASLAWIAALACAGASDSTALAQAAAAGPRAATPPVAQAPAVPAPPTAPPPLPPGAATPDLEARLADARRRLEAAAREVAELSLRAPVNGGDRLIVSGAPLRRAIIGVVVERGAGRDGARIAQVSPGGPADAAGLRAGDVLQSLGGVDLRKLDDPSRAVVDRLAEVRPDETLRARVLRDGKVREVELVARRSPVGFAAGRVAPFDLPLPPPSPDGSPLLQWLGEGPAVGGLELATVTPGLGRYFGTDEGVLVVRAPRQAEWKLEDGDVILAIDGREPSSGAHATRILRSYQRGETLKLRVMRQRKPLELSVAVPETEGGAGREVRMLRLPPDARGEAPPEVRVGVSPPPPPPPAPPPVQ